MIVVDISNTYTEQFGRKQNGRFIDIVQPVFKKAVLGFDKSVCNIVVRLEQVDWNKGTFKSTGGSINDNVESITTGVSWRPISQTVFRFNYKYSKQRDLLGNPPSRVGAIQLGFSTYF